MPTKKTYQDPHAQREAERYDNPVPSREIIMQVLKDQERPLSLKELTKLLSVTDDACREAFGFRIKAMLRDCQLLENRSGNLCLVDRTNLIAGRVEAHDGFGFVLPDGDGDDLFLSPKQLQKVMHGDRVLVLERQHLNGRRTAQVIEITQRAVTSMVGRYYQEAGSGWLVSESRKLRTEAKIVDNGGLAPEDDVFYRASIANYPDGKHVMRVRLEERIASEDDAGMEIEVALRNFDLPFEWPAAVEQQAAAISDEVSEKDKQGRFDLRQLPLVTIDGEDARDFDDAVYVEARKRGGWRLIVAIADVSHYVRPNTPLDREGHLRGTSVYFPSRVIPMLPEKLSNGLCSLNPNVDRLCLCCDMTVSAAGRISSFVFREGVMRSHSRLTYTKVAALIEEPKSELAQQLRKQLPTNILDQLHAFHDMYRVLRSQRELRGAIDFESTETRIIFDDMLKIEAIVPTRRNVAHTMIEEAMLAANVCAARLLEKQKMPALYRNHEGPKLDKLAGLREFLGPLGIALDWNGKTKPTPAIFQKLAAKLEGRPDRGLIQLMMLRTLTQARYEAECKGHFGLAYSHYTHFTSPIRRYPDLLVHRALRYLIRQDGSKQVDNPGRLDEIHRSSLLPFSPAQMVELGEHCSMAERRADDASRDVMKWLKCQFMEQHIGDEFSGTISGVTGFGLFVEVDDLYIDGLVHIASLGQDYFRYDSRLQQLQGEASGYSYRLGDRVTVQVAAVVTDERKIDFQMVDHQPGKHAGKAVRPPTAKKNSSQKKPRGKKPAGKSGDEAKPKAARRGPPRGRKSARRNNGGKSGNKTS